MSTAQNVSASVRRLRKARGWTQTEAGERFGAIYGEVWSATTWMFAEKVGGRRQRSWTANELAAVAELFGVTVDDLMSNDCTQCEGAPPQGFTCNLCGLPGGSAEHRAARKGGDAR